MLTEPIRVKPGERGKLIVQLPYSSERVAKIKTIAGRRWHRQEQYWSVPQAPGALTQLLTLFDGESVEVDPSLDAVQASQQEEKPFPESPSAMVDRLCAALRARHYARRTEQAYRPNNDDRYACPQPRAGGRSQSAGRTVRPLKRWRYADPHKMP